MTILRAMRAVLLAGLVLATLPAHARSAQARIGRVVTPVGTMADVRVDLDWPAAARQGAMRLRARRVDAPALAQRFADVDWRCVLRRDGWARWRCEGPVRTARGVQQLAVAFDERGLDATLRSGARSIRLHRGDDGPDLTRVDLTAIPLAWMRGLLATAWPEAQLKAGEGDARLAVTAPGGDVRITGPLDLRGVGFDTPDGRIAAENMAAHLDLDLRFGETDRVGLRGRIGGGEALFGTAYLALAGRSVDIALDAEQSGSCCWRIPKFEWRDDGALNASGALAFGPDAALRSLRADVRSDDIGKLREPYLSGWLGAAGLGDLAMRGPASGHVEVANGALQVVDATLGGVDLEDPKGRFAVAGLEGDARYSAGAPVRSALRWTSAHAYGLAFGAARLPLESGAGRLAFAEPVDVPMLGGRLHFDHLAVQPATAAAGTRADFGLDVSDVDVGQLAAALGLPAFTGRLSGRIPSAHYEAQRLVFDGGLGMAVFGGRLDVSALAMERPFGVAPTLSADIAFDDLD
ncbi:hypothetical protein, partial [Lysobacter xanthus]